MNTNSSASNANSNTANFSSTQNKLYIFANILIYILILILGSLLFYNIFIFYKNNSTHTPPKNSINVSPTVPNNIHDVFIEN